MKKNQILLVILFVLSFFLFYYIFFYFPQKEKQKTLKIKEYKEKIREFLLKEILISPVLINFENENEINAKLPLRFKLDEIKFLFKKSFAFKDLKFEFKDLVTENSEGIIIKIYYKNQDIYKIRLLRSKKAKIGIIIDDWGYDNKNFNFLDEIKFPFSVAILPNHKYSGQVEIIAFRNKKEILLHQPMQPKKNIKVEKLTIKNEMSEGEIKYILLKNLEKFKYVKGISNHEGSAVTEDKRTMTIILNVIKDKNLYFVDSKTSDYTVGYNLALQNGIKATIRDVFLDNTKEKKYIQNQFALLKKIAKKKGHAIGIGHCNYQTLSTLKEEMEKAEKENFEFVYVTELLK